MKTVSRFEYALDIYVHENIKPNPNFDNIKPRTRVVELETREVNIKRQLERKVKASGGIKSIAKCL